ncbi:hypothetical protein [Streptomyces sp. SM1]|uniref:hypothetical protein n=1 Tax=Streptomyces sp. SM1 TaxID=402229 RepID=UPI0021562B46|nr:hypothetical protein [Streptomyces sp. SM1]
MYKWASKPRNAFVPRNPVPTHQVTGRYGQIIEVPDDKAKNTKASNVHWLTPRTFRLWVDVGLRGRGADGLRAPGWVGRLEDRNVAFVRLLYSSGLRRLEGASLLTFEVPSLRLEGGRYYTGRLAAAVTRSKQARTYYVAAGVVGDIENYVDSSRAEVIRKAQAKGRYDGVRDMRLVTKVTRGPKPIVHWQDRDGAMGRVALTDALAEERMTWYTEGPNGPEPLWLWLNERGLPFQPHSWENVFTAANKRCRAILDPASERRLDPHSSKAPYATPHSCRHSFALYMLVILHHLLDQRMGLTPEERRDYRLLYGDPWRMVQDLLGHSHIETTRERYLSPGRRSAAEVLAGHRTGGQAGGADRAGDGRCVRSPGARSRGHPGHRREDAGSVASGGMSRRGRTASLPTTPQRRPPVLVSDGFVVKHRDGDGHVETYDFRELPVSDAMRRSLARLFAARCVPSRWASHLTSRHHWVHLETFAEHLSALEEPVADLDALTAAVWKEWELSRRNTQTIGYKELTVVSGLLLDDPRLTADAREALSKRIPQPKVTETSFEDAEFAAITSRARRTFRSAHLRITENARHLADWRSGSFARDSDEWLLGEALDCIARTGEPPCYATETHGNRIIHRYMRVLGGENSRHTWQRLFLTRMEAVALGVLLMAEHGWNLSVISRLAVPRATPDAGTDGNRIYRVELEKRKRGGGHYFETRNLTDYGADTPGRLITQALEATVFARAAVHELRPGTDRFVIWRTTRPDNAESPERQKKDSAGLFRFGITGQAAKVWSEAEGFASSPFRRGRRTVNVVHRREPGQNSQDTHDSTYVLTDPRAQAAAIPVIAAAAEAVVTKAREVTFAAQVRETADPADHPTATADCHDYDNSPFPSGDGGCGASFLMCLACPNARVHPAHHSRLAHLHHALDNLRTVMDPGQWQSDWGDAHARLEHLKRLLGADWDKALTQVTAGDRELIDYLLNGDLDQ